MDSATENVNCHLFTILTIWLMWLAGATRDSASIDCFQFFLCLSRASSSNTQPSPHAVSPGHMHLYSHICPHRVFMVLPKPGRKEGHSWAHFLIQEIPTECSLRCQKDARQREFKPPSRSLSMGNCLPLGRMRQTPKEAQGKAGGSIEEGGDRSVAHCWLWDGGFHPTSWVTQPEQGLGATPG